METTIFVCQQKAGSKDNGTFKTPSVPISFTLGLAATFLCCLT